MTDYYAVCPAGLFTQWLLNQSWWRQPAWVQTGFNFCISKKDKHLEISYFIFQNVLRSSVWILPIHWWRKHSGIFLGWNRRSPMLFEDYSLLTNKKIGLGSPRCLLYQSSLLRYFSYPPPPPNSMELTTQILHVKRLALAMVWIRVGWSGGQRPRGCVQVVVLAQFTQWGSGCRSVVFRVFDVVEFFQWESNHEHKQPASVTPLHSDVET